MPSTSALPPPDPSARARVVVANISPSIDGGQSRVKRVRGDRLAVQVDLLLDGHDKVAGLVSYRQGTTGAFGEVALVSLGQDRFGAEIALTTVGVLQFTVAAWVDEFATWAWGFDRKLDAGQEVTVELLQGIALVTAAARRASGTDGEALGNYTRLLSVEAPLADRARIARDPALALLMQRWPDRTAESRSAIFEIEVDPPLAQFSSWYEFFPRSTGRDGRHGTFADAETRLPYVADMGFDVVYLPPIHPIGASHRKGPNNTLQAGPEDPGSPWAIGAAQGGHKAVNPALGTLEDFRRFVARAQELGIAVAIDIAFQASPDHPYVREHPEWFVRRPDGSIQYAENPPKKYQDVYPFDFAGEGWQSLWQELASVFFFWIEQGVRVFRVDNPHTKPLPFWRWCLRQVKDRHPDVIFLSEAFTRPKLMYGLAKAGFSQSYTYFTWRTSKRELEAYLTEITRPPISDHFRPNLWPNTPDILPEHLQIGTRATFAARLILAGTLSSSYGIYGPPFELMEQTPRPGSEEYIDNEKFQIRSWDLDRANSLRPIIKRLNRIRRENPALQSNESLVFHPVDNELLIAYSKSTVDGSNLVLTVVNLDAHHRQTGYIDLDLAAVGMVADESFQAHDLISDARYLLRGGRIFVELDPNVMPAHVFRLRRRARTEHTFEYYL